MRLNKAAVRALVAGAGAGLAQAQDYCSDRSTIIVTEYVTVPGPAFSTPALSSIDGVVSSPTSSPSLAVTNTTSIQVVTIRPVPATATPSPMITSTVYTTSPVVNDEGETIYSTVSAYTTVCPASESAVSAADDEPTTTIRSTSSTTKLVTITVPCADCSSSSDDTIVVTVPQTTTVCPVSESGKAAIALTSSCTRTRTVTVDAEPVTVTVTHAASVAEYLQNSYSPSLTTRTTTPTNAAPTPHSANVEAVNIESAVSNVATSSTPAQTTLAISSSSSSSSAAPSIASDSVQVANGATIGLSDAVTAKASFYGGGISSGTCSFSGYTLPASLFGTALSSANWDSAANCGACVNIKGSSGQSITAMIVDKCAECKDNQLDLFEDAFGSLSGLGAGVIDISWELVECGITSALQLTNKDGSSAYWFSMQVVNSNLPVASLHVSVDGGSTWTETTRTDYNFFEYENGFGTDVVDVKVTSTTGKEVVTKNVTVASSQSHTCDSNF